MAAPVQFLPAAAPAPFSLFQQPVNAPSVFQLQVTVQEGEPLASALKRFKRAVSRAGILQEARRHRFFETTQEKAKRKAQNARRSFTR
eukprot:tig00000863_g4984.t1